ncbi:MAG: hypothetical protein NT169_02730, partial [Chloroflexi bacterium]|nr:hypothetical protein [Chloroflexota bacterium]
QLFDPARNMVGPRTHTQGDHMRKTQKPLGQTAFLATLLPTAEPWAGNRLAPDAPYISDLVELIHMAAVIPAWQPLVQQLRERPRAWPERTAAEAEMALAALAASATAAVPTLPGTYQMTTPLNSVTLELGDGATYLVDAARLVRILACTDADRVMACPGACGPIVFFRGAQPVAALAPLNKSQIR